MKSVYAKVFLYAYPWLGALSEAMGQSAENKALLSYRMLRTAEEDALSVVTEYAMQRAVEELYAELEEVVASLDAEERFLVRYKYFHGQGNTRRCLLPYSERTYFRKQEALIRKIAEILERRGWTDARFIDEFGTFGPFLRILRALRAGKELAVWEKRKRGGTSFQNSARSGS